MASILKNYLLLFFIFITSAASTFAAQQSHVDYNPSYKSWAKSHQLDKIEYTSDYTIIHIRFAKDNSNYLTPVFQPSNTEFAWVLESNDGTVYQFLKLSNITKNGVLELAELGTTAYSISALSPEKKAKTFFSCQLYFPKLPVELDSISLVEGRGYKNTRTHLNCLDIQLKNEHLGSVELEQERIALFEQEQLASVITSRQQPLRQYHPNDNTLACTIQGDTSQYTPKQSGGAGSQHNNPSKIVQKESLIIYEDVSSAADQKSINSATCIDHLTDYKNSAVIINKPSYKTLDPDYYLDKIAYTESEIILSLRFSFKKNTSVTFHPLNNLFSWFAKENDGTQTYPVKAISRLCRNGILLYEQMTNAPIKFSGTNHKTVFTCRIHLERLPDNTQSIDLIEGVGKEDLKACFNFFKIKIMPQPTTTK